MTTTGSPSAIGLTDNAAPRSTSATPGAGAIDFADLLAPPAAPAPVASLTLLPALETADTSTESIDDNDVDEYSPEDWLAFLTFALSGEGRAAPQPVARLESRAATDAGAEIGLTPRESTIAKHATDVTTPAAFPRSESTGFESHVEELAAGAKPNELATQVLNARLTASAASAPVADMLSPANEPNHDWVDAMSTAGSTAAGTRSNLPHSSIALTQPVGTPGWQEEIATRVAWLVRGAEQTATLTLNPADLGPVEVRVAVRESEATVVFSALHADTRAALEAALPRLREMFAMQGLLLTDGSVLAESSGGSSDASSQQAKGAPADLRRAMRDEDDVGVVTSSNAGTRSLLDLYA
jgi:flagellar hook-length control protein FliK